MALDQAMSSDTGEHNSYTQAEVVALITPLVPEVLAEEVSAYVIVVEKTDGNISIARSTQDFGKTIRILADTISQITQI